MTKRRRLFMTVVVVLSAVMSFSACSIGESTDPGGNGGQSSTPTASPSSPPPSPPVIPETATEETVKSGVAFVAYYYKLVEYGHLTGNWGPAQKLTNESCEVCQQFWSTGELFKQKEDVISEVGTPNGSGIEGGQLQVTIVMDVGVGLAGADSEIEKFERATKTWQDQVTLEYNDGWRVVGIEPDQLLPTDSCIANRCTDAQKKDADGAGQ